MVLLMAPMRARLICRDGHIQSILTSLQSLQRLLRMLILKLPPYTLNQCPPLTARLPGPTRRGQALLKRRQLLKTILQRSAILA